MILTYTLTHQNHRKTEHPNDSNYRFYTIHALKSLDRKQTEGGKTINDICFDIL